MIGNKSPTKTTRRTKSSEKIQQRKHQTTGRNYPRVLRVTSILLFASYLSQLPHTLISPQFLFTILNVYMFVWVCMCAYEFSTCITKATTQQSPILYGK